jgi:type VI secretion system protein ImpL
VAPLSSNGVVASGGPQTVFQLLPMTAPGVTEYTIEIDGQQLRYRNTPPAWVNMVHPGPQGVAGAKVSAVTFDGRTVELFNEPGDLGLTKLMAAATTKKLEPGVGELRWTSGSTTVAVTLKVVSSASSRGDGQASRGFSGLRLPETVVGRAASPAASPPVAGGPQLAGAAQ